MSVLRYLLVVLALPGCRSPDAAPEPLVIHAAASLTDVLPRVGEAFQAAGGPEVTFSFESSSRLARQIEAGAPGDVFVSADEEWMEHLAERELIAAPTRTRLLG